MPSSARAGDDVAAVGHLAPQHRPQEGGLRGLRGALGRPHALDLGGDQRGDEPQQRRRAARRTARAGAAGPTTASPTRSSSDYDARGAAAISARSSAVERAATASTALERSIRTRQASSARGGGADHLGQARRRTRPRR